MATYHGYITVAHNTYSAWRAATLNNSYDVDGGFPAVQPFQCWDFCALGYFQFGRALITKPGGGNAADCWNVSRYLNSKSPFISLTGVENIKRGDILVWNTSASLPDGHIGYADEDYNGTNYINVLGQNQGGRPYVNIQSYSLTGFLGIFRNTLWVGDEPEPVPVSSKKRKFPWAVAWAHWDNFKN